MPGASHQRPQRGLRLVALLAFVAVLLYPQSSAAFDSDKIYHYKLHGAVTARVADEDKPQYSGYSIATNLLVKQTSDDELTVKLVGPKVAPFNQVIEDFHRHQFDFKPFDADVTSALQKPFRIYKAEGVIKSFDTYKDEPKWVTNYKRGLLSFFQLKLQPQSESQQFAERLTSNEYFTTNEKSVFGECETDYLVLSSGPFLGAETNQLGGPISNQGYLNVTKTRNMAKCKTRFMHRFMPVDSTECYENERELQQYKSSNAVFNFNLIGDRRNYVIERALVDEVSSFSPFGQKAHSHIIQSKFVLMLDKIEEEGSLSVADGAERIESLAYDPPEMLNFYANINLDEAHHLTNIYQTSATVDQVMTAFEALAADHKAYAAAFELPSQVGSPQEKSRMGEKFIRLNELLGTLNLSGIGQLLAKIEEKGEANKIFYDLLSVSGTNPSFMFMKKLITDGDAPSVRIKDFLTRVSYHIKMPSKSLFDEYVNLCKSDKIQANQQYKRLCSLPLASLIHQHCVKPHARFLRAQQEGGANATLLKKAQNTCQIATAEEYFTRLVAANPAAGVSVEELSLGDKLLNVKMAGELGVKPSIEHLMDVVRNTDEHPSLRAAAMWNLNKAARIYPNQVKRLVIPHYYDPREQLEVRIAAFKNWFFAGMSLHEMETLAKQLASEPSRQLVIWVNSFLQSMADIKPLPCSQQVERNAKLVLPLIKRALKYHAPYSVGDSHAFVSASWQPEYGYGTMSYFSAIYGNESMAPVNIMYSSAEIMSGIKLVPTSISVQAHGLDKLAKRVFGINGLLADKDNFMDVFSLKRRSKRQIPPAELIKQETNEIEKELKLGTRDFSDVFLAVTVRVYGRPITFFERDSRELKKMLSEDGTIKIPHVKKLLHSFNNHTTQQMMINFEKLEVFNNEMGLPLFQSINDFSFKTFKLNSIKLDVEPGFFKDERQGRPPTKLSLALDAKLGSHNEILVSTGAILTPLKQLHGAAFHKKKLISIPQKVAVELNLVGNNVAIKRAPIHENLLYIRQQPVTFTRTYNPSQPESLAVMEPLFDIDKSSQMRPFKVEYMTPLAIGLRVEGKHRAGLDYSLAAWRRYLTSVGASAAKFLYFYSPTGAPLELHVSTATTDENPTREVTTVFSWKHLNDESSESPDEIDKQLETFTGGQPGERPSTVAYKVALIGGSDKKRSVGVDINYSRSADKLRHKWRVFYQRTPLDQASPNSEVTNLCWHGKLQFPEHSADKLLRFDVLNLDHSANMTTELTFGEDCSEGKLDSAPSKVAAKFTAEWSDEQRALIEKALAGGSKQPDDDADRANIYLQLYKRCQKNREQTGAQLDHVCLNLMHRISELPHVKATFDYKDVPERWTKLARFMGSLYTYARAGYIDEIGDRPHYNGLKTSPSGTQQAILEANITNDSGHERKLSYEFNTPNYFVSYKNVPISVPPLSTLPLLGNSYYSMVRQKALTRSCSVSGSTVSTFDNLTFTMPQVGDGCLKLLAKDCSPESNFIVLGAEVGNSKVVKIYLAQKFKVEFVPDKDGLRISDIKVNGDTVQIKPDSQPLTRRTKLGPREVEAFSIANNGAYYTLDSKLYKFSVSTDGTWVYIQQSKYYAGKSCGLCGDANGDQLLEFKSPTSSRRVCKNTSDFVWSYVLPSTCAQRPSQIECA